MSVKHAVGPSKATFGVKRSRMADSSHAYARAAPARASQDGQSSTDGERWVSTPWIVQADAELPGLEAATLYWFGYRSLTKEGISD